MFYPFNTLSLLVPSCARGKGALQSSSRIVEVFLIMDHHNHFNPKQNANSIWYSQAVTHPSTNQTQRCLTSLIGREAVCSTWYGRWREERCNYLRNAFLSCIVVKVRRCPI